MTLRVRPDRAGVHAYDGPVTQTVSASITDRGGEAAPPDRRPRLASLHRSDRFWGWAAPLLVMLVGGLQRFWHLDRPHKLVFDEVYYVKEGASYLRYGYEQSLKPIPTGSPDPFTLGRHDIFAAKADFVVHPPVGKWMIAAGERLLGVDSSWGWRFSAAVVGTVALLMVGRIARRLFGSTLLGTVASLLLAVDGQELVHSRTGLLDIFVMFWALAGFGALLIDRDVARARLREHLVTRTQPGRIGPWLGLRWWRIAGIVCLALDTGVKWSGLYFAAVFLTMSVLWDLSARRALGARWWALGGLRDGVQALATTLVLLPSIYLATWAGWFAGTSGWDRQWGAQHPAEPGWAWVPNALRGLLHYHSEMWNFNVNLHSPHPYQSNPWSWTVLGRPTAFFYEKIVHGQAGCKVTECSQAVTALGNPVIWWTATLGVGVLVFRWALARDWRAGAVLAGLVGGWVPWFLYQDRTIFTFYAVAFVPWVVLTVTYCLGLVLGRRDAPERRRRRGALLAGSYVFAAVMAFWFFFPILTAQVIPHAAWAMRMWLPTWI
jgi:dolichyl-phosphate-mannose--protein O-mannosyl transferase